MSAPAFDPSASAASTSAAALTRDDMRADIARALSIPPEQVGLDDNLADLGLDSMRVMDLISGWEERQPNLDYTEFMEHETLAAWWDIVARAQAA